MTAIHSAIIPAHNKVDPRANTFNRCAREFRTRNSRVLKGATGPRETSMNERASMEAKEDPRPSPKEIASPPPSSPLGETDAHAVMLKETATKSRRRVRPCRTSG